MYHGVRLTSDGPIYRMGLALLDLVDPGIVLHQTDEWVFAPEAPYEITGDVGRVVFPCGWVHDVDRTACALLRRGGHGHRPRDGPLQRGDGANLRVAHAESSPGIRPGGRALS